MLDRSLTPSITVTIGRHTRLYFAFVTTAPAELDSPATITLHAATFCGRRPASRRTPSPSTQPAARTPARLVLVDAMELAWQRAKYRGQQPPAARRRIPGSSASTRCSTGSGNACRPPVPTRSRHDSRTHSSASTARRERRAFQEVTSWSSRSLRTTKATRPANSRMPSCISPTAHSTA